MKISTTSPKVQACLLHCLRHVSHCLDNGRTLRLKKADFWAFSHILHYLVAQPARGQSHPYSDEWTRRLARVPAQAARGSGGRAKSISEQKRKLQQPSKIGMHLMWGPAPQFSRAGAGAWLCPPASCTQTWHSTCSRPQRRRKPGRELLCRPRGGGRLESVKFQYWYTEDW